MSLARTGRYDVIVNKLSQKEITRFKLYIYTESTFT